MPAILLSSLSTDATHNIEYAVKFSPETDLENVCLPTTKLFGLNYKLVFAFTSTILIFTVLVSSPAQMHVASESFGQLNTSYFGVSQEESCRRLNRRSL